MRWLLVLLILLAVLCPTVQAADTYHWFHGKAYVLRQVYSPTQRGYVWQYVLAPNASAATYQAAAPDKDGWRDTFAKILLEAKRYEAAAKKSANDHNEYLETIEALGANGALASQPYTPRYANGGTLAAQFQAAFSSGYAPIAGQGATVTGYGAGSPAYSFSAASASYPGVPLAQLYQSAASLAQQAQDLGGQAGSNFLSTVQQEGNNQARVAEILARAQAAATTLQAAGAGVPSPTTTSSVSIGTGNAAAPSTPPTPTTSSGPNQADLNAYAQVAKANCVRCHDGSDSPKKGPVLDFEGFATTFARNDQLVWIDRLTTTDASKRMPAGGSLDAAGIAAFTRFLKSE